MKNFKETCNLIAKLIEDTPLDMTIEDYYNEEETIKEKTLLYEDIIKIIHEYNPELE